MHNRVSALAFGVKAVQYLQNNQGACSQIVRDGSGVMTTINAAYINVASFKNTGLDFEASYRTRLADGQLKIRALANYVDKLVVDNGVLAIDGAGYLGSQAGYLVPKWRGSLTLNYESERMGADLRTRYVGSGGFAPTTVLANQDARISSHTYVDLGLRAYIRTGENTRFTVYGSVQNLFDRQPTLGAVSSPYLDIIGRYYTAGVRVSF